MTSIHRHDEVVRYYDEDGELEEVIRAGRTDEVFQFGHDLQQIIFNLEEEQTLILLYRHLGFDAPEIVGLLGLKNIGKYYRTSFRLRRNYDRIDTLYN
jgi:hypothetical protein